MKEIGISEVLTADRHFEDVGFRFEKLLGSVPIDFKSFLPCFAERGLGGNDNG